MKAKAFEDVDKILIRTPSYSYGILFNENGDTKNMDELIWTFLDDEKFLESMFFSSISLYKTIINLKNKELSNAKKKKILITLKKYLIRTSARPTPYGTFAGTSIQTLSEEKISEKFPCKKLRIDVSIMRKIIRSIENNQHLNPHLTYELNNTLYTFNNEFRYLEIDKESEKTARISSFEKNEVLNFIYSEGKKNKITFRSIFNSFSDYFDEYEFGDFFQELIKFGFLVSEIELSQTNSDELKCVKEFISKSEFKDSEEALKYKNLIQSAEHYISIAEAAPLGDFRNEEYENIVNQLQELGIFIKDEQIFHVDVFNQSVDSFGFSKKIYQDLIEAVSVLNQITISGDSQSEIQKFQKLFVERYDTNSVSLPEVLDPEIGIGYLASENIGSYTNNDFINITKKSLHQPIKSKQNLSEWLVDKIENLSPAETEIKIMQSDLLNSPDKIASLSNTFTIVGQIADSEKIILQSAGGSHANTLLSRFAYMSLDIQSLCKNIADHEKQMSDEVIFAEIVWIPDGKAANITRKLVYTDYEIPVYYKSSLPKKNQICLDDILVSVENDEVVLKSKKLKKRIIPRLSSAHNFEASTNSAYKFLCALQNPESTSLILKPDFVYTKKRFFPRIRYKDIILHPSCWILQEADIKSIKISKNPVDTLKRFFEKWNVNKFVLLSKGDNELFIDSTNDSYLDILLDEMNKNSVMILKEWMYNANLPDSYITEFILPLKKNKPVSYKKSPVRSSVKDIRSFFLGEEWVYYKIYCNANYSDLILTIIFKNVIKKFEKYRLIEKWFFIRFQDPHYHIRLRIQLKSADNSGEIISLIRKSLQSLIRKNTIWKMSLDTYNRELERYSHTGIDYAEYAFYKDSYLYLKMVAHTDFQEEISIRLFAAAKNVDSWLELFSLDLKAKRNFCEGMKNSFAKEQSKEFLLETEEKYRKHQDFLFAFIKNDTFDHYFRERNRDLKKISLDPKNIQEFIHMSINRWFITNQRNWEFLIYYFCLKYYNRCLYSSSSQTD